MKKSKMKPSMSGMGLQDEKLKPGKITLRYIKTNDNDKILEEEIIELPYLLDEVKKLLRYKLKNGSE
jgi:hypothetical protein